MSVQAKTRVVSVARRIGAVLLTVLANTSASTTAARVRLL